MPSYIRRIAEHLIGQGKSTSVAIATAVNTVKRWAAGGTVTAHGGPRVSAKTQAQAQAALADWNRKKAQARSLSSFAYDLIDLVGDHKPPYDYKHGWIPVSPAAQAEQAAKAASHPKLYHASTSAKALRAEGFTQRRGGGGAQGAFFGEGTYFHTDKNAADQELVGYKMFVGASMEQLETAAHVDKPFVVNIKPHETDPGAAMHRALREAGLIGYERKTPAQIRELLEAAGYDAVEVRQKDYTPEIGGSQLVIFDAGKIAKPKGVSLSNSNDRMDLVTDVVDLAEGGAKWSHGWVPLNDAAKRIAAERGRKGDPRFKKYAGKRAPEKDAADEKKAGKGTHVVKKGDTLWALAARELGDGRRWKEIAKANGVKNPRLLQIGTRLTIPGGVGGSAKGIAPGERHPKGPTKTRKKRKAPRSKRIPGTKIPRGGISEYIRQKNLAGSAKSPEGFEYVDLTPTGEWDTEARRKASSKGQAMPGGRFPIKDKEDVRKAIRALGRAKGSHAAVKRHVMARARALGCEHYIPDSWKSADMSAVVDRMIDLAGRWKHGWIPLDAVAALAKAKGNHALASKYLGSGRSLTRSQGTGKLRGMTTHSAPHALQSTPHFESTEGERGYARSGLNRKYTRGDQVMLPSGERVTYEGRGSKPGTVKISSKLGASVEDDTKFGGGRRGSTRSVPETHISHLDPTRRREHYQEMEASRSKATNSEVMDRATNPKLPAAKRAQATEEATRRGLAAKNTPTLNAGDEVTFSDGDFRMTGRVESTHAGDVTINTNGQRRTVPRSAVHSVDIPAKPSSKSNPVIGARDPAAEAKLRRAKADARAPKKRAERELRGPKPVSEMTDQEIDNALNSGRPINPTRAVEIAQEKVRRDQADTRAPADPNYTETVNSMRQTEALKQRTAGGAPAGSLQPSVRSKYARQSDAALKRLLKSPNTTPGERAAIQQILRERGKA